MDESTKALQRILKKHRLNIADWLDQQASDPTDTRYNRRIEEARKNIKLIKHALRQQDIKVEDEFWDEGGLNVGEVVSEEAPETKQYQPKLQPWAKRKGAVSLEDQIATSQINNPSSRKIVVAEDEKTNLPITEVNLRFEKELKDIRASLERYSEVTQASHLIIKVDSKLYDVIQLRMSELLGVVQKLLETPNQSKQQNSHLYRVGNDLRFLLQELQNQPENKNMKDLIHEIIMKCLKHVDAILAGLV